MKSIKVPTNSSEALALTQAEYRALQKKVFTFLKTCQYIKSQNGISKISKVSSDSTGYIHIVIEGKRPDCITLEFRNCVMVEFGKLFLSIFDLDSGEETMVVF